MAYILDGAYEAIDEWLKIPMHEKEEYRKGRNRIPLAVRRACKKLFPNDENKWLNFRDLRHIIGVHFAQKGIPTEHIAKSMGNTAEVSRKHYQGFMLHDEGMEVTETLLSRKI